MFGGECEIIYNPKFVWHEIHIRNDDVIHFYLTITRDFVYDFGHRYDIFNEICKQYLAEMEYRKEKLNGKENFSSNFNSRDYDYVHKMCFT